MREFILKSNIANPAVRMVCGVQNAFLATEEMLEQIVSDTAQADSFDLLYDKNGIEVYEYIRVLKESCITFYNLKYIAARVGLPEWIVVQGCIPVNNASQLKAHQKHAKRQIIKAIKRKWSVDLMKKGA